MKFIYLCPLIAFFFCCNNNVERPPQNLAKNMAIENCPGRSILKTSLSKTIQGDTAVVVKTDSNSYCSAERLYWHYCPSDSLLQILHTRRFYPCMSTIDVKITQTIDSIYHLEEKGSESLVLCDCTYDTYCCLPLKPNQTIKLELDSIYYDIDIAKTSGIFVIDSSQQGLKECLSPI
jgi:hypothetical protein